MLKRKNGYANEQGKTLRLVIAVIFIFVWAGACAPAKKHRKRHSRPNFSERYYKKSQPKILQTIKKNPRIIENLPPVINNPALLPTILNKIS